MVTGIAVGHGLLRRTSGLGNSLSHVFQDGPPDKNAALCKRMPEE